MVIGTISACRFPELFPPTVAGRADTIMGMFMELEAGCVFGLMRARHSYVTRSESLEGKEMQSSMPVATGRVADAFMNVLIEPNEGCVFG